MIQETFPMIIGEDEVLNERQLLTVEDGPMMHSAESVKYLILHCSATRSTRDYPVEQLLRDHKARGFRTAAPGSVAASVSATKASGKTFSRCKDPRAQGYAGQYSKGLPLL